MGGGGEMWCGRRRLTFFADVACACVPSWAAPRIPDIDHDQGVRSHTPVFKGVLVWTGGLTPPVLFGGECWRGHTEASSAWLTANRRSEASRPHQKGDSLAGARGQSAGWIACVPLRRRGAPPPPPPRIAAGLVPRRRRSRATTTTDPLATDNAVHHCRSRVPLPPV